MHAAFGLQIAIRILALDQDRRRLDPRLFARMVIDQLHLHPVPLGPSAVHALQHSGPIVALGSTGARVDFDIAVVGVGFARQQRRDLVALRPLRQLGERANTVVDQGVVALHLGQLDQFDRVLELRLDLARRSDCLLEAPALAHHLLRRLRVIPQRRILDLVVQFAQPPVRLVPVEEPAKQSGRGIDLVDMGLRFGAHEVLSNRAGSRWP
jgi:hypothetical protein